MFRWVISLLTVVVLSLSYFFFSKTSVPEKELSAIVQERPQRTIALKQKICLNMIVKNESKVIKRCLDSIIPLIDYWVIVDTGSDDETREIIKNHLKDIPGELHERPWKNFAHNRNEALKLAQAYARDENDYILFMDADDILQIDHDLRSLALTKDLYNMWRGTKDFTYTKPQLVRANLPWKWVGVTHEYLGCDQYYQEETLEKIKYITLGDGASSRDTKKFYKNVELLEAGLKEEPGNHRYVFYLAESYRDAGERGKALEWYQKAVDMKGWDEEVFWSKLQIALHLRYMGLTPSVVIKAYKDAHNFRPHRVEPVYYLAEMYNELGQHEKAYNVIKARQKIRKPAKKDSLFNVDWMEEYGLLFQFSICAFYAGHYQESLEACDKLLSIKSLPPGIRRQTEANRTFPLEKLSSLKEEEEKPAKKFLFF
jgi:glycosyltransferase involved in cell wall biosynthesis